MKNISTILLLATLFIISCKKEKNDEAINQSIPTFTGYTSTAEDGSPTNLHKDTSDWTLNDKWSTIEKEFFEDYDSYNESCILDSNIKIYPGYPNAASDVFYISLVKDSTIKFKIRLVNQKFETLASLDSLSHNSIAFDVSEPRSNSESMLRVYYMFITESNCLHKGHGDIKLN